MGLYWLTFKRSGRLAGVAIVSANTLMAARMRAATLGIAARGIFEEGHVLDPDRAACVLDNCVGWFLTLKEVADLLERIERAAGKVQ